MMKMIKIEIMRSLAAAQRAAEKKMKQAEARRKKMRLYWCVFLFLFASFTDVSAFLLHFSFVRFLSPPPSK